MVALLLGTGGCVENRARRDLDTRTWTRDDRAMFVTGKQLPQFEPATTAAALHHNYDLSFIEFDEQGDYWDRRQLGWTIDAIKREARAKDLVLLIYVHGWQNDAGTLPGHDVDKFEGLLNRLASTESTPNRRFFGVYIAWRGKSVPGGDGVFSPGSPMDWLSQAVLLVPHELSLYDRQRAAIRTAGMPITEAIFASVNASRTAARESGHLTRSILIGHSFGALIVEKALCEALAAQVIVNDAYSGQPFPAPADTVLLLNSAAQSIYAKELMDMLRRRRPAGDRGEAGEITADRPLVVSVTSTADSATGTLFPIGVGLGNIAAITRQYDWDTYYGPSSHGVPQRQYLITTPGHNDWLISHDAVPLPGNIPAMPVLNDETETYDSSISLKGIDKNLNAPISEVNTPDGKLGFVTVDGTGGTCHWAITPRAYQYQTPYWIIQVPKQIMREHSDIFNENSLSLLARLVRLTNPDNSPGIHLSSEPRTMQLAAPGTVSSSTAQ